ncbi:hypothetical protein MRBLMR1_001170 [Neorhizobium sp. LMR1-1-1.1]
MSEPIVVDIGAAMQTLEANPDLAARMADIMGLTERFYLSQDNDGHWYVVPVAKRQEWITWLEIPSDDDRAWTPPEFAKQVGGSPCLVMFTNPEIL